MEEPIKGAGDADSSECDYAPFRMNTLEGLTYYKAILETAENADRFLFEITRNNFLAFGALSIAGTTGILSSISDRRAIVIVVCIAAIGISVGSAILSVFYFRYSTKLFGKAWTIEKAWLRGKRSDLLLARLRDKAGAETPASEEQKDGGWQHHMRWPLGFYFSANLFPAVVSALMLCAVLSGLLSVSGRGPGTSFAPWIQPDGELSASFISTAQSCAKPAVTLIAPS